MIFVTDSSRTADRSSAAVLTHCTFPGAIGVRGNGGGGGARARGEVGQELGRCGVDGHSR